MLVLIEAKELGHYRAAGVGLDYLSRPTDARLD
jgi:hypothetical protein